MFYKHLIGDNIVRDYIVKCECYIHSLKQPNGTNVLAEATIIKKLGDTIYHHNDPCMKESQENHL